MHSDIRILAICKGCKKRKLYVSRKWIKPPHLPRIRPNEPMCDKCLLLASKY